MKNFKWNKKTIGLAIAAVLVVVLLFCFGGPKVRNFITEIANSTLGTELPTTAENPTSTPGTSITDEPEAAYKNYYFRNKDLLDQHFEKHGKPEMGFSSAKEYEKAASDVINNPNALHKLEKDGENTAYYIEATNEFVVLSADGYIRTYFNPSAGKSYYDRQ